MSDNYKIEEPDEPASFGKSSAKIIESEENCFISVLKNKTNSQTSIMNQYWALRFLARSKDLLLWHVEVCVLIMLFARVSWVSLSIKNIAKK